MRRGKVFNQRHRVAVSTVRRGTVEHQRLLIAALERLANKSKLRPEAPGICLGKIVPGVQSQVIGIQDGIVATMDDCEVLPAGQIGELIIGGPHVVQEYYNNPEAVRKNKIKDMATG